jgi:hypothetical protein
MAPSERRAARGKCDDAIGPPPESRGISQAAQRLDGAAPFFERKLPRLWATPSALAWRWVQLLVKRGNQFENAYNSADNAENGAIIGQLDLSLAQSLLRRLTEPGVVRRPCSFLFSSTGPGRSP